MEKANNFFIAYCYISRSLVCNVHFVLLFNQSANSATHGNHIIIRMRRKNNNPFRERLGAFRAVSVISIGLTTGPPGNGVLKIIEYFDVNVVGRAIQSQQFT